MKDACQPGTVVLAAVVAFDLVHPPRCPGMDGRVDIIQRPFIGRELAVGMHIPFARHQFKLALGELRIDRDQRQAVERQVPARIPGKFPFVRHRDDVEVMDMLPVVVATSAPG
jgi:hypothetical protein